MIQESPQAIPRPEYPRPQMVRSEWINLNGEWQFEIDHGNSGKARGLYEIDRAMSSRILVPFCPESKLSGIEHKDFMEAVWYKRQFTIPEPWAGKTILLHFGAVDYETEVWINGQSVGTHKGGYTPFAFDITKQLSGDSNTVTVYAQDRLRSGLQPRGKQSGTFHSQGCDYTRTTGIWQTVWLEAVNETYVKSFKVVPDADNASVHLEAAIAGHVANTFIEAEAFFDGNSVGIRRAALSGPDARMSLDLSETHLWEPGNPSLYDLKLRLIRQDSVVDSIDSYFGLRSIRLDGMAFRINGRSVFQRLVLDQGFYPDGIYTAPTDDDLRKDIELSMAMGFNGARLHEKVFEPRFLYWADRLGYLVWGEHANWGLDITTSKGLERFLPEWMEAVERDFNHPSLIGWCPFNETWDHNGARQNNEVLRIVYQVTKKLDPTRPVIDTSGNFHVETDIFDVHDYDQNPETFKARYEPMKTGGKPFVTFADRQSYAGQPYFVSEYGGIWWNPGQKDNEGWGYGNRPQSEEEFLQRYEGLTQVLLENPMMFGFCYTQLYDIEQEVNGLYTYERKAKFDPSIIRQINSRKAAIEEEG
ncbi:glycoside hydrolase family 2 protein [Paenibacillus thermotolerans]|uniref:glycoside hydrolase family 2 protein n=1 Tax=Paenibacillus thermotolerans TaxID=3027807 RepID=UPI002367FEB5|nr:MULTISPECIES: sugar-binding domain-containing protein [unclassified Paenibacillus]